MPINIQDYLLGKIPVGRKIDIPAYLMAKAASGGGIQEVSGTLPLTVRSRASQVLKNYMFYGTASGAGVETENLWNFSVSTKGLLNGQGLLDANPYYTTSDYIPVTAGQSYTFRALSGYDPGRYVNVAWYDSDRQLVDYLSVVKVTPIGRVYTRSYTAPNNTSYVRVCGFPQYDSEFMFVLGSTAPSSYIPHGYKLPITVTSNGITTDYPVYIGDSKLGEEEYVDYDSGKVWKRYGELTLKGDETNLYYYGNFHGVQAFYIELPDNYQLFNIDSTPYLSCNYYSATYIVEPAENKVCRYQRAVGAFYWNIGRIYMFDNDYTNLTDFKAHLAELYNNGAPLKISYLLKDAPVPTDPPVPLPDIALPQGEVTIDIDEDINPQATIKGKFEQIT